MFLNLAPLRKHRDYRLLYTGQLVSMFGSMITYVAVPYQVFELTHSSFLVGMLGASQLIPLLLFAVSAMMSACNGFHRPALDAMTPRLVDREDLTAVSALNFFRFSISAIGGPALGGVCMAALGYPLTYTIDVVSFLVSLLSLAAIRKMPPSDHA